MWRCTSSEGTTGLSRRETRRSRSAIPQEGEKRLSSLRDSDLFPTLPSTPPAAPCWARLFLAYLHPSSPAAAGREPGTPATALDFRAIIPPCQLKTSSRTRSEGPHYSYQRIYQSWNRSNGRGPPYCGWSLEGRRILFASLTNAVGKLPATCALRG